GGDRRSALREAVAHGALENRDEKIVLAAEIEIDGAGGDAGRARDVRHLCVEEASVGEDVGGGAEDQIALRRGSGRRGGRPAPLDRLRTACMTRTSGDSLAGHGLLNECSFSRRPRVKGAK